MVAQTPLGWVMMGSAKSQDRAERNPHRAGGSTCDMITNSRTRKGRLGKTNKERKLTGVPSFT